MEKERLKEIQRRTREQRRKRERNICFAIMLLTVAVIFALVMACGNANAEETYIVVPVEIIEPEPEAEPVACEAEAPETNENELIEQALLENATKIENVTMTHYCICRKCCGKSTDDPSYGITASGRKATPYVSVAVDPDVIPLGSDVLVDYGDGEIHYYRADDTGGSVDGNHIDLCVGSHQEAINLGVKSVMVWVVTHDGE